MKHSPERECNVCGCRVFTPVNSPCPHYCVVKGKCPGVMCSIITPLPGKRVSGVLCRDKGLVTEWDDIVFFPGLSLNDIEINRRNVWGLPKRLYNVEWKNRVWTTEEWKARYGKLPRKGSKSMVIIELTDGK